MKKVFVLALLSVVFIFMISGCQQGPTPEKKPPQAANGILDLSQWDLEKDGPVKLDGEWELYWEQLLTPRDFEGLNKPAKTGFFNVPGYWQGYDAGSYKKLSGDGYATFRLTIKLGDIKNEYALKAKDIFTSHKIWANGEIAAAVGVVGKSKDEAVPRNLPEVALIRGDTDTVEIIIQASNFVYRSGEMRSLLFGTEKQIIKKRQIQLAIELFLFGCALIMGFYHIGLYILRRKDSSSLYFGLFCLLIALRTVLIGERFFVYLFPGTDWELFMKIAYLTFILSLPLVMMFVRALYPQEMAKKAVFISQISAAVCGLIIVFTPNKINHYTLIPHEIATVIGILYMVYVLIRAALRKREGAAVLIGGYVIISVLAVNDMLYDNGIIQTGSAIHFGLLIFIFSQSAVLAMRFQNSFAKVEELSERLLSLDRLKDEFLANTSHELRTPLNGIIGIAESMAGGVAGKVDKQQEYNLSLIISSGRRLASLVNDVLDFTRLKNKDIVLQRKPVDIRQVAQVVLSLSKPLVFGKSLELRNEIPEYIPPVDADENRLQQILYNLIGNAVKFTNSGSVTVTASQKGMFVEVWVSDTGIGIPKDKCEEIFRPFEQAGGPVSGGYGGTGLGLNITKILVMLHGGSIGVESEPGIGSKFIFTLPVSKEKVEKDSSGDAVIIQDQISPRMILADQSEASGGGYNILVADDELINLQVLVNHLSLERYTVLVASNGMEALEKIRGGNDFDLVVLDVMMPKMSGYEVCRAIREKYSLVELPVLLLTAKSQPENIMAGFEAGANDYLVKPFDKRELLARVRTLITMKQAVSHSIVNAARLGAEKKQRLLAEKLRNLNKAITSTLDLSEVMVRLLENLAQIIQYEGAAVLLRRDNRLEVTATRGKTEKLVNLSLENSELLRRILDTCQPVMISDVASQIGVPLILGNDLVGILFLDAHPSSPYTEHESEIAFTFAEQAAIAIENARLFSGVKQLAITDGLTGLYNIRYFYELAEFELKRAKRYKYPLSLIMIDIDHFKKVNDTHGHLAGDEVLKSVARRLKKIVREIDVLGRYGGEEFLILLPNINLVKDVAERVRRAIEMEPVHTGDADIYVTASIGVSMLSADADLQTLFRQADAALYKAKEKGRNRVAESE